MLVYFLCENCNHPLFSSNHPLKLRFDILSSPPFENLVEGSTSPAGKGGGGVYTVRREWVRQNFYQPMSAEQGSLGKYGAPKLDIMQKSLEFISFG